MTACIIQLHVSSDYLSQAARPKLTIPVDELACTFVPDKIGQPNGMQIIFEVNGSTRSIFVYSDDGRVSMLRFLSVFEFKVENTIS